VPCVAHDMRTTQLYMILHEKAAKAVHTPL